MIVVGSCYFLLTLVIPYDPNIDFVFPLNFKETGSGVGGYRRDCHWGGGGGVTHIHILTTAVDVTIVGPLLLISVRLYF